MKLFVSDFGESLDIADLAALFGRYGRVTALRILQGQKRTYALVDIDSDIAGQRAIQDLNGKKHAGQWLQVKESWW